MMLTYMAVSNNGDNAHFSAWNYGDAYSKAHDWAADKGGLRSLDVT